MIIERHDGILPWLQRISLRVDFFDGAVANVMYLAIAALLPPTFDDISLESRTRRLGWGAVIKLRIGKLRIWVQA